MKHLKMIFALMVTLVVGGALFGADDSAGKSGGGDCPLRPERTVIDTHRQIASMSCIPSGVELILKLTGRIAADNFDLQKAWKNKSTGGFKDFDGKTVEGLTFRQQFAVKRGDDFPMDDLFATITAELRAGRYVEVSLGNSGGAAGAGWHMWVIVGLDGDGEFYAVSKDYKRTIESHKVKANIRRMKGTDILTYTETAAATRPSTTQAAR